MLGSSDPRKKNGQQGANTMTSASCGMVAPAVRTARLDSELEAQWSNGCTSTVGPGPSDSLRQSTALSSNL